MPALPANSAALQVALDTPESRIEITAGKVLQATLPAAAKKSIIKLHPGASVEIDGRYWDCTGGFAFVYVNMSPAEMKAENYG